MGANYGLSILRTLASNKSNLQLCVDIAKNCAQILGPKEIINVFEQTGLVEAVYLFLQGVAATIDDKDIVFRFIQAAVRTGQTKEVERVVRESKSYDAKQVKDFLKEVWIG
jgi:clathrin heavy chain